MASLLIDVGNTQAKYCVLAEGEFEHVTHEQAKNWLPKVDKIGIAQVASNEQTDILLNRAKSLGKYIYHAEVSEEDCGVKCGYEDYKNLGIDRWLAILASELVFPSKHVVVVDAGTALTIDCLTADKHHLGGWIIPGIELMQSSIVERAPKVFIDKKSSFEQFGTDTPSAVINGTLLTCVAAIHHAVELLTKKTGENVELLITGGDKERLSQHLELPHQTCKDLVFIGLNRLLTTKF